MGIQTSIHPTIRKCLQHLDVIKADDKTKQIVYMYMESLLREKETEFVPAEAGEQPIQPHSQ